VGVIYHGTMQLDGSGFASEGYFTFLKRVRNQKKGALGRVGHANGKRLKL